MPVSIRNPRRHQVESGEAMLPTVIQAVDTGDGKKFWMPYTTS